MAPRPGSRKDKVVSPSLSPRKTRSGAVGKRVAPPKSASRTNSNSNSNSNKKKKKEVEEVVNTKPDSSTKSIIIEACKQCNAFKTRALKVKEGLETALPAISVTINPQKPRRGCFEIREEGGQIFVSLLNMPRPFTPMKKLDMDELVQDIIKKIG